MPTTTRAKLYTRLVFCAVTFSAATARGEWTVDFSRRTPAPRLEASSSSRGPASVNETPVDAPVETLGQPAAVVDQSFFSNVWQSGEIAQEIVIMNTEKGFVPANVRVKSGLNYKIHIVNVNDKERNVSFVMDAFSEHHGTFYGKVKTFVIRPQKEGIYSFVSPETAAQGQLVVMPAPGAELRRPAAE